MRQLESDLWYAKSCSERLDDLGRWVARITDRVVDRPALVPHPSRGLRDREHLVQG